MKKILAINYSQSGQLDDILNNFLIPFKTFDIDRVTIQSKPLYPFPWTSEVFFDTMPETVFEEPIELAPYTLKYDTYDLIIIGYQPWFLSPSLPITSLFSDPKFKAILNSTPVATVIGARNMWLNSQESIVNWVQESGGIMVANVPYIDKVQNHISALTILHWMLTGKKTKKWGFLPLPGVAQREIDEAEKIGVLISNRVNKVDYNGVQSEIIDAGDFTINSSIMLIEARAKKLFRIWAKLIKSKSSSKRPFWVSAFKWYLVVALFVVSPPVILIHKIFSPLMASKIKKNRERFLYLGIKK